MQPAVTLVPVTHDHLPIFFEHQKDAAANLMADFPARDKTAHLAHWRKILDDDAVETRTILSGDEVVGNIGSWVEDGNRLVGYWIGSSHWGRGIATEALHQFLDIMKTRPLLAHVAAHNVGSQRVLEKCGFERDQRGDWSGEDLVFVLEG